MKTDVFELTQDVQELEKMLSENIKIDFRWFDAGWYIAPDGRSPRTGTSAFLTAGFGCIGSIIFTSGNSSAMRLTALAIRSRPPSRMFSRRCAVITISLPESYRLSSRSVGFSKT